MDNNQNGKRCDLRMHKRRLVFYREIIIKVIYTYDGDHDEIYLVR